MTLAASAAGIHRLSFFPPPFVAGYSGRSFDNSRRSVFLEGLGLRADDLVMVKQVHGNGIEVVDHAGPEYLERPADALVTARPGIVLGIRTADCVPVFFASPRAKVVGIAHGGWKGVKLGIVPGMLGILRGRFGVAPENLLAATGPSIRECCYEVGPEFKDHFPGFYRAAPSGKGRLDLVSVIRHQLLAGGVPEGNIHDAGICTSCRNGEFFSYRRERETRERILNVISLVG
ncbi:MAG TPA: peptidoglycan editing factor PgeF [Candidatus Omnitrophota bacterium]|nr:peptidoglycan editing factor PgeF [Candidatus Omnitrophota bacterium]